MKTKAAKTQVRLAIVSNAGGSGKTTVASHLAWAIGVRGYKVVLIELDHNGSLAIFGGLPPAIPDNSLARVLQSGFKGNYPLIPLWPEKVNTISILQGGQPLDQAINSLYSSLRKHYTLADRLEDCPLDADLIIYDTPASLEPMGLLALAACTHLLAPVKPEWKDAGSLAGLYNWYCDKVAELRLRPRPQFLGFVPCRVDLVNKGTHRDILGLDKSGNPRSDIDRIDTLPGQIERLGIECFPMIRESNYYLRASGVGLPLHLYRPGSPFAQDFEPIAQRLIQLMTTGI